MKQDNRLGLPVMGYSDSTAFSTDDPSFAPKIRHNSRYIFDIRITSLVIISISTVEYDTEILTSFGDRYSDSNADLKLVSSDEYVFMIPSCALQASSYVNLHWSTHGHRSN